MISRSTLQLLSLGILLLWGFEGTDAFPRRRAANDGKASPFGRRRVILHGENNSSSSDRVNGSGRNFTNAGNFTMVPSPPWNNWESTRLESRQRFLLQMDVFIGWTYCSGLFLFPIKTILLFFGNMEVDGSTVEPVLKLAVRMVAVNHVAYGVALLAASPSRAIPVATGFLALGGLAISCYAKARLDSALLFWSCTIITTALVGAHFAVFPSFQRQSRNQDRKG